VWHIALIEPTTPISISSCIEGVEHCLSSQQSLHGIGDFAGGRLKWELHTEFLTLTLVAPRAAKPTNEPPEAFQRLCELAGGQVIAAICVLVRMTTPEIPSKSSQVDYVASEVGGGDAEIQSSFRLNESGFVEIWLFNSRLNAYRTGRMVRRLLEIETYRMMALLAMPTARYTVAKLSDYDHRLSHLITHMQNTVKVDKELLSEVTRLSSDVLNFSAIARQRFGAAKAYAEIVHSRIAELREERVDQRQRVGIFIDRRFQPAMRSVAAAERRLDELGERVRLAGDLLRTTI
jgi:uncharacterized membrane-anchored protein